LRNLPIEPKQQEKRVLELKRDVPSNHIYITYHCCNRYDKEFYATDLLSDILSRGKSSRLYQKLVKEKKIFTEVGAYMLGELDKSLFLIEGSLIDGVSMEEAELAINEVLEAVKKSVSESELLKVKNKAEASLIFSEMSIANKALNLAYFELLGDASLVNVQSELYNKVTAEEIQEIAKEILSEKNSSVLRYYSK
jgi:predicted Zn-dependent peptidase